MLRIVAVFLAVLSLAGCAVVSSERPLFSVADGEGAPVVRPGVWAMVDYGCKFNARAPAATWPDCVSAFIVGPSTLVNVVQTSKMETGEATVRTYQLVAGDPVIAQIQTPPAPSAEYYGLRAMAADAQGQITKIQVWMTLCDDPGPVDPQAKPRKLPAGLYPAKTNDQGCLARTPAAVRAAVRRSETWATDGTDLTALARWIRDGDR